MIKCQLGGVFCLINNLRAFTAIGEKQVTSYLNMRFHDESLVLSQFDCGQLASNGRVKPLWSKDADKNPSWGVNVYDQ